MNHVRKKNYRTESYRFRLKEDAVIEIRDLVKDYDGNRAVNGLSLTVSRGEIFGLLGPNGAGKTTTVEIIEGIRGPTSGTVRVLGLDPVVDKSRLVRMVGILPQDFNFIELTTPLEILRFYTSSLKSKLDPIQILSVVDLVDKKDSMFEDMSGGQKQKLGIAIALCNDPEILFLDEPTAGLDPVSRRNIWGVIENMRKMGKTVFLTTHYLDEAEKLADRVAIMKNGMILAEGTPQSLLNMGGSESMLSMEADGISISDLRSTGYEATENNGTIEVKLRNPGEFFSIIEYVKSRGAEPRNLFLKRESLEDVFIKLIGKEEDNES